MAISANMGRDTDHNSTKLVCAHPLVPVTLEIIGNPKKKGKTQKTQEK